MSAPPVDPRICERELAKEIHDSANHEYKKPDHSPPCTAPHRQLLTRESIRSAPNTKERIGAKLEVSTAFVDRARAQEEENLIPELPENGHLPREVVMGTVPFW